MLSLRKPHNFSIKIFFSTSIKKSTPNWRIQIKETQLVSQVSKILLQRHTKIWTPLLKSLKFSSRFSPSLFLQILTKIQTHPDVSLNFFKWAKKNLNFEADLIALCKMTRILFGLGLSRPARPILDTLVQDYPPSLIVYSLIKGSGFHIISSALSALLECYCHKCMYLQAFEVYNKGKEYGVRVTIDSCNSLLKLLSDENEIRLAWCFYGSITRNGVLENQFTWSLIAKILYTDGKFERIARILDMRICTPVMYNLLIECYSKRGDFRAAFGYLDEMCNKKIETSFSTYSSILDGLCKYQDVRVSEEVLNSMVEKGYLPEHLVSEYDLIIQKLSDLGNTHAADLFFKRSCDEKIQLQHKTYGCMLKALSKEGRVKDAIGLYHIMQGRKILVNESYYNAFMNVLCKESLSEEVSKLLVDMVRRGFSPAAELSEYINRQCAENRWGEAEELLNVMLDKGCFPDSFSCGSLVKHYCSSKQIDSAIALHNKLKGLEGTLDARAYNVLLTRLFEERRVEEALGVFDYMRTRKVLGIESFSLMIRGLCHGKELRKAMKLHDEMLELGLKPDGRTYKRLISGFG
ncbi:Tetratricopeptide repeat (TPR)-like superfamily protein [Forsythia ovata]|uniref:Tetratricopeptide repeat (TPR)-like superfamily protein n=1 Tax=Forsythia ovata TaxID=205694 RepID=A0ABD1R795_9LAMI